LLFDYLVTAAGSGWALLLVYWALALPVLGQEIGFLIQQYPRHRNVTLRLVEPLGAPDAAAAAVTIPAEPPATAAGAEVRMHGVAVRLAGHEILAIDTLGIAAGSHVAIVGASGSGKTSLVGLLLGWHEPSEGRVLVDGQPLESGALARLRRQTVWVEPGVYLWNRSLLDNLRYGASAEGTGALGAAIEEAELDEVLGRLPVGLQTSLGEGGALLSGGEGQRVRFGRGVLRGEARLVVLDEAFRGLERPRRLAMLERARARWKGATLLCVTHDVAHTLGFDRVLVMADGRIAEDGGPTALAAQAGSRYRALLEAEWRVQARLHGAQWRQLVVAHGGVSAPVEARSGEGKPP
jgi:ATP-binding cassette subfamily B protein